MPPKKQQQISLDLVDHSQAVFLNELIHEILSRLKVKSLVRFKCVSKSWETLISDPHLAKLHLHRSNSSNFHHRLLSSRGDFLGVHLVSTIPLRPLLRRGSRKKPKGVVSYDTKHRYRIVGSCNGLLCLAALYTVRGEKLKRVRFWNPVLGLTSKKSPIVYLYPNSSYCDFGFGYVAASNTYKVVAILHKQIVRVFSPGDSCWRKIQNLPMEATTILDPKYSGGMYLNGTLNWVGILGIDTPHENPYKWNWKSFTIDQLVIVSLDLESETWKKLSLPQGIDETPRFRPSLNVLRDCLCFCHDYKETHFVVWQLRNNECWTQLIKVNYVVDLYTIPFDELDSFNVVHLCMSEEENEGDVVMFFQFGCPDYLYRWKANRLICYPVYQTQGFFPILYVESLVRPYC